jgi:signal transduction histidine kinase
MLTMMKATIRYIVVLLIVLHAYGKALSAQSVDAALEEQPAWKYVVEANELYSNNAPSDSVMALLYRAELEMHENTSSEELWANFYLLRSKVYRFEMLYEKALVDVLEALAYYETQPYGEDLLWCYYMIGFLKMEFADYDGAVREYSLGAKIADSLGLEVMHMRMVNGMGSCFFYLKEFDKAELYFKQVYSFAIGTGDSSYIAVAANNLGNIHAEKGESNKAIKAYLSSLQYGGHRESASIVLTKLNLVESYIESNVFDSAMVWLNSSYRVIKEENQNRSLLRYYFLRSQLCSKENRYKNALVLVDSALHLALEEKDYRLYAQYLRHRARVYEKLGDFEKAYESVLLAIQYKDTVWNNNVLNTSNLMEQRFQVQKKVQEIEMQNVKISQQQNDLLDEKQQKIILLFALVLVIVLLLAGVYFSTKLRRTLKLVSQKKEIIEKSNKELSETIKTRDKLMSIMAHDIKNPLGTISGFSELILISKNITEEKTIEYVKHIFRGATNLYTLLDNLLQWSKNQKGALEVHPQMFHIRKIIDHSIDLYEESAKDKQIIVENNVDEKIQLCADVQMVDTVFRNLLNNALKFTQEGGKVVFLSKLDNGSVIITVIDNGAGMVAEDAEKIFKPNTNYKAIGKHANKGSGLGLQLCHEFVLENHGEIWVESEYNKGTTFFVRLPLQCH